MLPLLVFSFVTHFFLLFQPNHLVFDEYNYVNFTLNYLRRQTFLDVHPPAARLILLDFARLTHLPPIPTLPPSAPFPNPEFALLRLPPAFFGFLLTPLVWYLTFTLTSSRRAAFLAALFVTLDSMLLLQSRLVLADSLLWLFLVTGLLLFTRRSFPLSGIFLGLAASVKWTGGFGLLTAWVWTYCFRRRPKILHLAIIPALTYLLVFFFQLPFISLPSSGSWFSFHQLSFSPTLPPSPFQFDSSSVPGWFIENHLYMIMGNSGFTYYPFTSRWWQWPLGLRPIQYSDNLRLVPNYLLWLLVLAAVVYSFASAFINRKLSLTLLTSLAWLTNLLPFSLIRRPTFLYHYGPSLIFGIITLAIVCHTLALRHPRLRFPLLILLPVLIAANFVLNLHFVFPA